REPIWIGVLRAIAEDWRRRGAVVVERRDGESGRVSFQPVFAVSQSYKVVVQANAAANHPLAIAKRVVRNTSPGAEDPVQRVVVDVILLLHDSIRHPVLQR